MNTQGSTMRSDVVAGIYTHITQLRHQFTGLIEVKGCPLMLEVSEIESKSENHFF